MRFSLQVYINTTDAAGIRRTVSWHPEYRDHKDPEAMYRLRIAAKPSPDVNLAVRSTLDQGKPRVDVYTWSDVKGLEAKAGNEVVVIGSFDKPDLGNPHITSLLVPLTATEVVCERGAGARRLISPDSAQPRNRGRVEHAADFQAVRVQRRKIPGVHP